MVRKERLELSRVTPLEPKSSASTNSATLAMGTLTLSTRNHIRRDPDRKESIEAAENRIGGPCRIRTYDQLIKSQLLYHLS